MQTITTIGLNIDSAVAVVEMICRQFALSKVAPRAAGSLSTTAENSRLRIARREVWRRAKAALNYWRRRINFDDAVDRVQRMGLPEGRSHAPVDDDRRSKVESWRAAIVRQLLTPAPDSAPIKWKQAAFAGDDYLAVKPELVERAIADDLAFLAAHPVRQSNRRRPEG